VQNICRILLMDWKGYWSVGGGFTIACWVVWC